MRSIVLNKKGEMTAGTVVALVISVAIIAVAVYFIIYPTQFKTMLQNILPDMKGKANQSYGVIEGSDELVEGAIINPASSNIVEFKGAGNFEVLSNEECRSGLEQRKKDLGIPEKLCYWQAMTEVYDAKCDNLDKAQISAIFEKKEEYRQLNNTDWPSLNIDGDFCVPVIYDCGEWVQSKDTYGYVLKEDPTKAININPFLDFGSISVVTNLVLHEGLHSMQIGEYGNLLGDISNVGDIAVQNLFQAYPEMRVIYDKRDSLTGEINNLYAAEKDKRLEEMQSLSGTSEYVVKFNQFIQDVRGPSKYLSAISSSTKPVDFRDYFNLSNSFYVFFDTNESYISAVKELNDFLETDFTKFPRMLLAFWYVAKIQELDPRLSEVHRYWFDKTAPNCEILDTPEKFGIVLQKFLADTSVAEEYKITQRQLNDVMEIADKMGKRDEIWNKLIGRGPGLASNTDLNSNEMYA